MRATARPTPRTPQADAQMKEEVLMALTTGTATETAAARGMGLQYLLHRGAVTPGLKGSKTRMEQVREGQTKRSILQLNLPLRL